MILKAKNDLTLTYDDNGQERILTYDDTPYNRDIIAQMEIGVDYPSKTERSSIRKDRKEKKREKPDTFLTVEGGYKKVIQTKQGLMLASEYLYTRLPKDCYILSADVAERLVQ